MPPERILQNPSTDKAAEGDGALIGGVLGHSLDG